MDMHPGLIRWANLDVEQARRQAEEVGYATYVLPAQGVVDRPSFFEAVRVTLPLDPPVVGCDSWDALSDSLWEGLYALADRRIAVVWPNARTMASVAAADFEMALNVLRDVAGLLADERATRGHPKEVSIIVQ
jgi:hypothetical protein